MHKVYVQDNRYAMFLQFILFCIKIYRFPKTTCTYDNIEALGFLYEAFNAVSKFSFMLLYVHIKCGKIKCEKTTY